MNSNLSPERTAVRTALWRALHVQADPPPHVLVDELGLKLLEPAGGWRERHDMLPALTARSRASIVARARFIEDLLVEKAAGALCQYVLLGAGLDTFALRRPEGARRVQVFEMDQPGPQAWKRDKLIACGFGVPPWLRLVPVDFETSPDWRARLEEAGFDPTRPAVVASTGVIAFLTRDAVREKLRQVAAMAPNTTLALTFLLPQDRMEPEERAARATVEEFARKSGNALRSFFAPGDMITLAREAGFGDVRHVSAEDLTARYFSNRSDGLRPSSGEEFIVATVLRPEFK